MFPRTQGREAKTGYFTGETRFTASDPFGKRAKMGAVTEAPPLQEEAAVRVGLFGLRGRCSALGLRFGVGAKGTPRGKTRLGGYAYSETHTNDLQVEPIPWMRNLLKDGCSKLGPLQVGWFSGVPQTIGTVLRNRVNDAEQRRSEPLEVAYGLPSVQRKTVVFLGGNPILVGFEGKPKGCHQFSPVRLLSYDIPN